ncbi:MAG: hypothetical protein RL425_728, partial [Pseudomonadota bacterium]
VKSYHSTTVERPATTMDRRDIGARDAGGALRSIWAAISTTGQVGEFLVG